MIPAETHLVVGPTAYIGLQAQGRIVCDAAQVPIRQRTRDAVKVTCPICSIPELAAAAAEAATAAYRDRLRRERARRLYAVDSGPLQEVDVWLGRFRRFWTPHLEALATELARGRRERRAGDPSGTTKEMTTP